MKLRLWTPMTFWSFLQSVDGFWVKNMHLCYDTTRHTRFWIKLEFSKPTTPLKFTQNQPTLCSTLSKAHIFASLVFLEKRDCVSYSNGRKWILQRICPKMTLFAHIWSPIHLKKDPFECMQSPILKVSSKIKSLKSFFVWFFRILQWISEAWNLNIDTSK